MWDHEDPEYGEIDERVGMRLLPSGLLEDEDDPVKAASIKFNNIIRFGQPSPMSNGTTSHSRYGNLFCVLYARCISSVVGLCLLTDFE